MVTGFEYQRGKRRNRIKKSLALTTRESSGSKMVIDSKIMQQVSLTFEGISYPL